VRRETGKAQVVQVHYDEGLANHIGPESCVGIREDVGEASAGECAGQPLSHDRTFYPGCRRGSVRGRQYGGTRERERSNDPAWSETLEGTDAPCAGTGDLSSGQSRYGMVRIGKARSRSR
jgi:hypothetical protein